VWQSSPPPLLTHTTTHTVQHWAHSIACPKRKALLTQDVPKVDMKQAAIAAEHEVVQVAVADAQDVRHHAVPGAALHKGVQHLRPQAKGPAWGTDAIAETDWIQLALFGMQNRTFGPYLPTIQRTLKLVGARPAMTSKRCSKEFFLTRARR
jgi:hypothetical protein